MECEKRCKVMMVEGVGEGKVCDGLCLFDLVTPKWKIFW